MKELQEYMDNVNDWIDEAEKTVNEYNDDMNEEEKNKIKDKIEVSSQKVWTSLLFTDRPMVRGKTCSRSSPWVVG